MPPSAGMLTHLAQSPTFLCEVWRLTARDGAVAAYANRTRDVVYDGTTYKASPAEPTRAVCKINLQPDSAELRGVYDSIITEADIYAGRWRDARIRVDWVCYRDLSLGSAKTLKGFAGKWRPGNGVFTVEFLSMSSRLDQPIGEVTGAIDRNRRISELGIDITPYTHVTTVDSIVTSRRIFKVPYVQPSDSYFRHGLVEFTTGANAGREFEIKESSVTDGGTRTQIELQKATVYAIAAADACTLYRGYDGTRNAAKALGEEAMWNFRGEPDMPLPDDILRYQP